MTPTRPVEVQEALADLLSLTIRDPDTECWEWTGKVFLQGHGIHKGRPAAWRVFEAIQGLRVLPCYVLTPSCGNLRCVNPDHMNLSVAPSYSRRSGVLISMETAYLIRELYQGGVSPLQLSWLTGYSLALIQRVLQRELWGDDNG